jgi:nucleotide-binding universal stress UspA family protein
LFKRVLVPLDGSNLGDGLIAYVCYLATAFGSSLVLHSVLKPNQRSSEEEQTRKGYLKNFESIFTARNIPATSSISFGSQRAEILKAADSSGCDLIAMATHSRNILGRMIYGSVTDGVIRSSTVPVLVVAPQHLDKWHEKDGTALRIILPLDGSTFAEAALPVAERLGRVLSSEMTVVRVIDTGEAATTTLHDDRSIEIDPDIQREAMSYLGVATRNLLDKGMKAQEKLLVGSPGRAILELTYESPSIVVITSHNRAGVDRFVEGSVAHKLIRESAGPVLVVPVGWTADASAT